MCLNAARCAHSSDTLMTDSTGTVTLNYPTGARGHHTLLPGLWETLSRHVNVSKENLKDNSGNTLSPLSGLSRKKLVVDTEILTFGPVSGIWLISNRHWLRAFTNLSLKQPSTFVFRNVQLTEWLVVFVDVPNQVS